jgi:hypothetical protein
MTLALRIILTAAALGLIAGIIWVAKQIFGG